MRCEGLDLDDLVDCVGSRELNTFACCPLDFMVLFDWVRVNELVCGEPHPEGKLDFRFGRAVQTSAVRREVP